jgi:hypothetical protein
MSKIYRLYVDESGDHTYREVDDPGKRYLGITGSIIRMEYYRDVLSPGLENLKRRHFNYDPDEPPILHRTDLVNRKGCFWVLRNEEKRQLFDDDLLAFFREGQFGLITVVIDKKSHNERYGDFAFHPYHYCITALLERYCGFLNFYNAKGDVMAESRGGTENRKLKRAYERVYDEGTQWRGAEFFSKVLTSKKLKIKDKKANITGLQLSDLLAYPIKQEILLEHGLIRDPGEVFGKRVCEVVSEKHNRQHYTGRISGYGKILLK